MLVDNGEDRDNDDNVEGDGDDKNYVQDDDKYTDARTIFTLISH